jgi:hypothetical protein
MDSWKPSIPALLALVAILSYLLYSGSSQRSRVRYSSPRQLGQVIQMAQKLGLHYRGDRAEGPVELRLLVSDSPLPWERANALVVGRKVNGDWVGTVAVMQDPTALALESHEMTPWGRFLLYGDPALIKKLTEQPDSP